MLNLLCDQNKRFSIDEAINHEFFKKNIGACEESEISIESETSIKSLSKNIENFKKYKFLFFILKNI